MAYESRRSMAVGMVVDIIREYIYRTRIKSRYIGKQATSAMQNITIISISIDNKIIS